MDDKIGLFGSEKGEEEEDNPVVVSHSLERTHRESELPYLSGSEHSPRMQPKKTARWGFLAAKEEEDYLK